MLHPSTQKLIDKLIEMTASSKISWKEGDDDTCIYDTEGYRVTIGQSPSRVVLLDASGRVLETVSDAMLANTRDSEGQTYSVKVDVLVSTARREITGATAVIDHLVSFLNADGQSVPDVDEAEDEADYAEPDVIEYPDHPEMSSRVAMLANSLNAQAHAEQAPENEVGAPEEPTDEATATGQFEAETSGLAAAGASFVATETEFAGNGDEDAGPSAAISEADDEEPGDGWTVPEIAAVGSPETVEDYVEEAQDEPVGFTPTSASLDDEDALTESLDGLPSVDDAPVDTAPEPEAPAEAQVEAVVYTAPIWKNLFAVNAKIETPSEYTMPRYVEPVLVEAEAVEGEMPAIAETPQQSELPAFVLPEREPLPPLPVSEYANGSLDEQNPFASSIPDDLGERDEALMPRFEEEGAVVEAEVEDASLVEEFASESFASVSDSVPLVESDSEPLSNNAQETVVISYSTSDIPGEEGEPELAESPMEQLSEPPEDMAVAVTDTSDSEPVPDDEPQPTRRTIYKYNPWM